MDIPEIRNVINFDVARDIDTHIHRIGRTGRAGKKREWGGERGKWGWIFLIKFETECQKYKKIILPL